MCRKYKKVPQHVKDDNVMPSFSEIPSLITSIRNPRRRAISVGPQSAADAYEVLAHREQKRRDSISSSGSRTPNLTHSEAKLGVDYFATPSFHPDGPPPLLNKVKSYDSLNGTSDFLYRPMTTPVSTRSPNQSEAERRDDEREDREMFSRLEKPRVRYDVEVVTKLIVYSGE